MIRQDEAERLATTMADRYLAECEAASPTDRANALMKLISVAGVMIARERGSNEAADRLEGTARFVRGFAYAPNGKVDA